MCDCVCKLQFTHKCFTYIVHISDAYTTLHYVWKKCMCRIVWLPAFVLGGVCACAAMCAGTVVCSIATKAMVCSATTFSANHIRRIVSFDCEFKGWHVRSRVQAVNPLRVTYMVCISDAHTTWHSVWKECMRRIVWLPLLRLAVLSTVSSAPFPRLLPLERVLLFAMPKDTLFGRLACSSAFEYCEWIVNDG